MFLVPQWSIPVTENHSYCTQVRPQDNVSNSVAYSYQNLHSDNPTSIYEFPSTNYIDTGIAPSQSSGANGRRERYRNRTLSGASRGYVDSQYPRPPSPHLPPHPPHTYVTSTTTGTYQPGPSSSNNPSGRRASPPRPSIAPFTHPQLMSSHGMLHSMSDQSSLSSGYTRLRTRSSSSFEQTPLQASTAPRNGDFMDDQSTRDWRPPTPHRPSHFVGSSRSLLSY